MGIRFMGSVMFEKVVILLVARVIAVAVTQNVSCTACPANGQFTPWTDLTTCTKTCGFFGTKIQTRQCSSWAKSCPCTGPLSRFVPCAAEKCPKTPFCATGFLAQNATHCKNVARVDDDKANTCNITRNMKLCPCPAGGVWSAWKIGTACTKTCGLCGTQKQTRTCLSAPYGCNCTVGVASRTIACPEAPCATGPKCCANKTISTNLLTNVTKCYRLPDDPLLNPVPKCLKTLCGKCTKATPLKIITNVANSKAFDEDVIALDPEGCVIREVACFNSVENKEAWIVTNSSAGTQRYGGKSLFTARAVIRCNGAGKGWMVYRYSSNPLQPLPVTEITCYPNYSLVG